jgi:hypothetical protein
MGNLVIISKPQPQTETREASFRHYVCEGVVKVAGKELPKGIKDEFMSTNALNLQREFDSIKTEEDKAEYIDTILGLEFTMPKTGAVKWIKE